MIESSRTSREIGSGPATDVVAGGEPARQRWAGLALMLAVALSAGTAPSSLGLAFYQMAFCQGVERVWIDLTREGSPERTGANGQAGARHLHGALAKAVRELLRGKTCDGVACPAPRVELASVPACVERVVERILSVGRGPRGLDRALFAQPPPMMA